LERPDFRFIIKIGFSIKLRKAKGSLSARNDGRLYNY